MTGRRFDFARPGGMAEALQLLSEAGDGARVLGGGSVLVPALTMGLEFPDLVLDPGRLGLGQIKSDETDVTIGATTTYAAIKASHLVKDKVPLLAAMAGEVTGGPGLWNLATLGGAVCYGSPASDGPGCLTALGAQFVLRSTRGVRRVPAAQFFTGAFETARVADEMLTEIVIPVMSTRVFTYLKVKNSASSWPIVTGSCLLIGDGEATRIRLCIGAAAATPIVMEWSHPEALDAACIRDLAAEIATMMNEEWVDELAGPGYRRAVAANVAVRALAAVTGTQP